MESLGITQDKVSTPGRRWRKWLLRTLLIFAAVLLVGLLTRSLLSVMARGHGPAGFLQGIFQGALMPAALPNLVVGQDVVIYAQNNTGVGYKLGYTAGVNSCGAVFFGVFFWRLNRWRKRGVRREAR